MLTVIKKLKNGTQSLQLVLSDLNDILMFGNIIQKKDL